MFFDFIPLTAMQIALAIGIIFFAYTIKGLSGFGSGLIAIPLLAFVLPLTIVVPVLSLLSYIGTIMKSLHLHKQVVWRDLLPLLPFSLLGIIIAIWLLVNLHANILILALGIFVLCYAIYSLLPFEIPAGSRRWAILAGCGGGIVGALFGTGGPFYATYLKLRQLDKSAFRATIVMIFLFDGGARMTGYAVTGLFTQQVLALVAILLPVFLAGMYVGNHLHIKINQKRFNQIISLLLILSSIMLIINHFNLR